MKKGWLIPLSILILFIGVVIGSTIFPRTNTLTAEEVNDYIYAQVNITRARLEKLNFSIEEKLFVSQVPMGIKSFKLFTALATMEMIKRIYYYEETTGLLVKAYFWFEYPSSSGNSITCYYRVC